MTPTGHIGASIILANSPRLLGKSFSQKQQLAVVVAGNFIDIDHLIPIYTNFSQSHHNLPSHTPLIPIIVWIIYYLVYGKKHQPPIFNIILLISSLLHLFLDSTGHWLYLIELDNFSRLPEINWLYPFTSFVPKISKITRPFEFINSYFSLAPITVGLEMLFISIAAAIQLVPSKNRK